MCAPLAAGVLEVQLVAAPEMLQVNVPVGAGSCALPETTAEKVSVAPTTGEVGLEFTAMDGTEVPKLILIALEVANK